MSNHMTWIIVENFLTFISIPFVTCIYNSLLNKTKMYCLSKIKYGGYYKRLRHHANFTLSTFTTVIFLVFATRFNLIKEVFSYYGIIKQFLENVIFFPVVVIAYFDLILSFKTLSNGTMKMLHMNKINICTKPIHIIIKDWFVYMLYMYNYIINRHMLINTIIFLIAFMALISFSIK